MQESSRPESPELEKSLLHENTQIVLEGRARAPDSLFWRRHGALTSPTSWGRLPSSRRKPPLLIRARHDGAPVNPQLQYSQERKSPVNLNDSVWFINTQNRDRLDEL